MSVESIFPQTDIYADTLIKGEEAITGLDVIKTVSSEVFLRKIKTDGIPAEEDFIKSLHGCIGGIEEKLAAVIYTIRRRGYILDAVLNPFLAVFLCRYNKSRLPQKPLN